MAQTFLVLKCFACETYQVCQVTKSNKWTCKVCNAKQSQTKVYGKGSAPDCRRHVQKLNMIKGKKEEAAQRNHPPEDYSATATTTTTDQSKAEEAQLLSLVTDQGSKWALYNDKLSEQDDDSDTEGPFTTEKATYEVTKTKRIPTGTSSSPLDAKGDRLSNFTSENLSELQWGSIAGTYRQLDEMESMVQYDQIPLKEKRSPLTKNVVAKEPPSRWAKFMQEPDEEAVLQ